MVNLWIGPGVDILVSPIQTKSQHNNTRNVLVCLPERESEQEPLTICIVRSDRDSKAVRQNIAKSVNKKRVKTSGF